MTRAIGFAVRDGDGIAVRLGAGARRGCYGIDADGARRLLGGGAAILYAGDAPVGDVAPSRGLRVLRGSFRAGLGFVPGGAACPVGRAAFLVPRAHLLAHYVRRDGPVPVLAGGA